MDPERAGASGGRQEPQLGVAAVARHLGVAPSTLRTWDRRYGIGPTGHVPGGHRRYSPRDVTCLEVMAQALARGATAADAAQHALATQESRPGWPVGPREVVAEIGEPSTADPLHVSDTITVGHPDIAPAGDLVIARGASRGRGGGGLRLRGAGSRARGLGRAAMALDAVATTQSLRASVAASGVQVCWDEVVRPVLSAVSQRWADTGAGIEVEHLLSECVINVFAAVAVAAGPARSARPVLLAGMPGEHHSLPVAVLCAALAQRQVGYRSLGSDLPALSLVSAMRRTGPVAMVLWSQLTPTADSEMVRSLPRLRPSVRIFVAGPGWTGADVPPRITRLETLTEAIDALSAAASPIAGR